MADGKPARRRRVAVVLVKGFLVALNVLQRTASLLSRVYRILKASAFVLLGGFVLVVPGYRSGYLGAAIQLLLFVVRYVVFWVVAGVVIFWVAPNLLAESRAGAQTALQVLPPTVVAVLVLVLGSMGVLAQMAMTAWGSRAAVMFTLDERVQTITVRPLLLAIATLLLSGGVPDAGAPADGFTAAIAATTLATIVMVVKAAAVLPAVVVEYTQPRSFPVRAVKGIDTELEDGSTDFVVMRGPMLGEMLKASLRREDAVAVLGTLAAMLEMQQAYLAALEQQPSIRVHRWDGQQRPHWLAEDLGTALTRAAELAMREGASSEEGTAIPRTLGAAARNFLAAGEYDDAGIMVRELTGLSTSVHLIAPGAFNLQGPPAESLAQIEAHAEEVGSSEVAAHALAGWALAVSYPQYHLNMQGRHPLWDRSIRDFGAGPPWGDAVALIQSPEWQGSWANKVYKGPQPLLKNLRHAQHEHGQR